MVRVLWDVLASGDWIVPGRVGARPLFNSACNEHRPYDVPAPLGCLHCEIDEVGDVRAWGADVLRTLRVGLEHEVPLETIRIRSLNVKPLRLAPACEFVLPPGP